METSGGIRASLAGRYASALFDLARDERQIDSVGKSLDALRQALLDSQGVRRARREPAGHRASGRQGVRRAGAGTGPRSDHRQLPWRPCPERPQGELRAVIRSYRRIAADHRGETTAEVVTRASAQRRPGRRAQGPTPRPRRPRRRVDAKVDPDILGGLVVKLGSQMIDASIRTKLNTLAQAMKG